MTGFQAARETKWGVLRVQAFLVLPRRTTTAVAIILAAVLAVGGVFVGGSAQASGGTLSVCVSGPPFCDHGSIQDAVDAAADGDTVQIFPGPYEEQVVIDKDLVLRGIPTVVIRAPAVRETFKIPESGSTWRPVVAAFGGSVDPDTGVVSGSDTVDVDISGIVVDGLDHQPPSGQRQIGVLLRNVQGAVEDNVVRNMYQNGRETFGILAYGDSDVTISGNDVSGYSRGGIGANGNFGADPAPTVSIVDNTVTGPGFGAAVTWAPNGIQIGFGAEGEVIGNTVTGNSHPSATRGSGIIVAGSDGVAVEDNTLSGNDAAVSSVGDIFFGTELHTTGLEVIGNDLSGNETSILLQNRTDDTTITDNAISGSLDKGLSLEDVASGHPAPTGTTVEDNTFADNPRHVVDGADDLDIRQVLEDNDFDRAAIVNRAGDVLGTIWSAIQTAVDATEAADLVEVAAGTYEENVTISEDISLLSIDGRDATIIEGDPASTALGTIVINPGTTGVQVGDVDRGFTVVGFDGASPGLEKAAVYLRGAQSDTSVVGNEIQADGETGLLSEWGAALADVTISDNVFSGKSFVGDHPAGQGFSEQFTLPNVPRQLVAIGSGGNATGFTFADNEVIGTVGGTNPDGLPQGNTLVTMDASDSTISGNTFAGTTAWFSSSLRARGTDVTLDGNSFDSSGLTEQNNHLFFGAGTLTGSVSDMVGANTFDRGAFSEDLNRVTVAIQPAISSVSGGSTVRVLPATYEEDLVLHDGISLESTAGRDQTTIVGQATGWTGNIFVQAGVAGARIEGFSVLGSAQAAIYAAAGASDLTVTGSRVVAADGKNALLTEGGQSDHLIEGNIFEGDASQLVYVNGTASVGVASSNVDVVGNTFSGDNSVALGHEASDSEILDNGFEAASTWASLDLWGENVAVTGNEISAGDVGVMLNASRALLTGNTIGGNGTGIVLAEHAGSGHVARHNQIEGNDVGANNASGFVFDARENWWGAPTGPVLSGVGLGDSISGDVIFSPWCGDPGCSILLPPVLGELIP